MGHQENINEFLPIQYTQHPYLQLSTHATN